MKNFYSIKSNPKKWFLLLVLFFIVSALGVSAQTIERLDDFLDRETGEAKYIQNLFTKQYSTLYVDGATIEKNGNGSFMVLKINLKDINALYNDNPLFREVELITIEVSSSDSQSNTFDLNRLTGFSNLLVVNFIYTYDECGGGSDSCLENKIQSMIQENDEMPPFITYKLSLPN